MSRRSKAGTRARSVRELLRHVPGDTPVDLDRVDPRGHPGVKDKRRAATEVAELAPRLAELQERLFAEAHGGGGRRLLLVLQGTDTGGKDGTIRHVVGLVNPQGVQITAFGRPSEEERAHDFLWRIRRAVPRPGVLGVFNRSHYEDVLVVRVHDLVPRAEWENRYDLINAFESDLVASGVTLVKVYLHLSYAEQRDRQLARLDDPTKRWKFNPADLDERALWPAYREAYAAMLDRCSTAAPWYVVPADRKWYRNWAVSRLLLETLAELDPRYPQPELDVTALQARLRSD